MDSEHIVKSYDNDLQQLDNLIAEMGGLCESQLAQAVDAMMRMDLDLAAEIIETDKKIDEMEHQVDSLAVNLIALRQPMAADLRVIVAALKVASNLERIGDYAKNISKRAVTLSRADQVTNISQSIPRMATIVQSMVTSVLDAYLARDAERARDVRLRDEEVDQMHSSLFRELLTYMMEDPRSITSCTHLLFVAKNIERIGDHITSVAEQIHFIVHGEAPEDERPKDDSASSTMMELKQDSSEN